MAPGFPSNLLHNLQLGTSLLSRGKRSLCGSREHPKGRPSEISRGWGDNKGRNKGTAGLRELRILEKEEKQQVVICRWLNHTADVSLSWSHRCTEDNLVWVLSRAENIPSPPCPRQVGDPARSHQGKPPPWARLLRESRGKLFDFYSASFSFTEDTHYKKTSTIASLTQSTPCLPCKAIV